MPILERDFVQTPPHSGVVSPDVGHLIGRQPELEDRQVVECWFVLEAGRDGIAAGHVLDLAFSQALVF